MTFIRKRNIRKKEEILRKWLLFVNIRKKEESNERRLEKLISIWNYFDFELLKDIWDWFDMDLFKSHLNSIDVMFMWILLHIDLLKCIALFVM
jgi:hypothetical protein